MVETRHISQTRRFPDAMQWMEVYDAVLKKIGRWNHAVLDGNAAQYLQGPSLYHLNKSGNGEVLVARERRDDQSGEITWPGDALQYHALPL